MASARAHMMATVPSSSLPYEPNPTISTIGPDMDATLIASLQAAANEDDAGDAEPAEQSGSSRRRRGPDAAGSRKRQKTKAGSIPVNGVNPSPGTDDTNFPHDGPFTGVERDRIGRFAETYRTEFSLTEYRLNNIVQSKERKMDDITRHFWSQLYLILPNRDHKAMQRHVRRRFHNFDKRGNWDPEEDEQLRTLYNANPNSWKAIGEELRRMPEDCRDRWRNYVICGDNRRTDHWTEEEEQELSVAVHDAIKEVRDIARQRAQEQMLAFREDQDWISQVNFNNVSAKVNHTRSRLQCLQHWKALQSREVNGKPKRRVHTSRPRARPSDASREAKSHYDRMTPAEKFQIVQDIRATGAEAESAIPWSLLAQRSTMRWTESDWRYAWSRLKTIDRREDFHEQTSAIVTWFQQNCTEPDLTHNSQVGSTESAIIGAAPNQSEDTMAIDPILDVETSTPQSNQHAQAAIVAESAAQSRRGRKSKAYKSADRVSSSSGSRSPSTQSSMLDYVSKTKGKRRGHESARPSDHISRSQVNGMQAPTARMVGGNEDDIDETEPELPPIRNEGENDGKHESIPSFQYVTLLPSIRAPIPRRVFFDYQSHIMLTHCL